MREYPPRALALIDGLAEELGIWLYPNLRLHNGTDGLEPLAAGYETASLCGCTDLKQPANYHWPNDIAENVEYGAMANATGLTEAAVGASGDRWLCRRGNATRSRVSPSIIRPRLVSLHMTYW